MKRISSLAVSSPMLSSTEMFITWTPFGKVIHILGTKRQQGPLEVKSLSGIIADISETLKVVLFCTEMNVHELSKERISAKVRDSASKLFTALLKAA